jgi:hypothetical protein
LTIANDQLTIINGIGGVAQLGEHLPCKQDVSGSIPLVSIADEEESLFFDIAAR